MDISQVTTFFSVHKRTLQELYPKVLGSLGVLGFSYVLASSLTAGLMSVLSEKTRDSIVKVSRRSQATATVQVGAAKANYHSIQKFIKDRNLFNATGEFPQEADPARIGEGGTKDAFNMKAPCVKPTVNVALVGTIYIDGGLSIATLQEQGYSESDVYKIGDEIIGSEGAVIADIERGRVILNNKGVKECIELAQNASIRPVVASGGENAGNKRGQDMPNESAPSAGDCQLEEKYVQDQLGPGFGTIIQKARLVPNTQDGQTNGFKIFSIEANSLFSRAGLQNGDVITQVNETSLKQADQGFALYQAFQDEREVRISILRGGTTPMMINCRIK